jgi:beta-phosphoglucomutase-like phosphatase (HAD superfamily)
MTKHDLVFLFDVDNTLLDNDRFHADLAAQLTETFGADACKLYWAIFEQLRGELGYADYLGALERKDYLGRARHHDFRKTRSLRAGPGYSRRLSASRHSIGLSPRFD